MNQRPAANVLENDFLTIRHAILNVAAGLDRIDEGSDNATAKDDHRIQQIKNALAILAEPDLGRAERVQLAFSRPYEPGWNKK